MSGRGVQASYLNNQTISKVGSQKLGCLANVSVGGATTGQVLTFNSTTKTWGPTTTSGGGGATTLTSLTDVNTTGVSTGTRYLLYEPVSAIWTAQPEDNNVIYVAAAGSDAANGNTLGTALATFEKTIEKFTMEGANVSSTIRVNGAVTWTTTTVFQLLDRGVGGATGGLIIRGDTGFTAGATHTISANAGLTLNSNRAFNSSSALAATIRHMSDAAGSPTTHVVAYDQFVNTILYVTNESNFTTSPSVGTWTVQALADNLTIGGNVVLSGNIKFMNMTLTLGGGSMGTYISRGVSMVNCVIEGTPLSMIVIDQGKTFIGTTEIAAGRFPIRFYNCYFKNCGIICTGSDGDISDTNPYAVTFLNCVFDTCAFSAMSGANMRGCIFTRCNSFDISVGMSICIRESSWRYIASTSFGTNQGIAHLRGGRIDIHDSYIDARISNIAPCNSGVLIKASFNSSVVLSDTHIVDNSLDETLFTDGDELIISPNVLVASITTNSILTVSNVSIQHSSASSLPFFGVSNSKFYYENSPAAPFLSYNTNGPFLIASRSDILLTCNTSLYDIGIYGGLFMVRAADCDIRLHRFASLNSTSAILFELNGGTLYSGHSSVPGNNETSLVCSAATNTIISARSAKVFIVVNNSVSTWTGNIIALDNSIISMINNAITINTTINGNGSGTGSKLAVIRAERGSHINLKNINVMTTNALTSAVYIGTGSTFECTGLDTAAATLTGTLHALRVDDGSTAMLYNATATTSIDSTLYISNGSCVTMKALIALVLLSKTASANSLNLAYVINSSKFVCVGAVAAPSTLFNSSSNGSFAHSQASIDGRFGSIIHLENLKIEDSDGSTNTRGINSVSGSIVTALNVSVECNSNVGVACTFGSRLNMYGTNGTHFITATQSILTSAIVVAVDSSYLHLQGLQLEGKDTNSTGIEINGNSHSYIRNVTQKSLSTIGLGMLLRHGSHVHIADLNNNIDLGSTNLRLGTSAVITWATLQGTGLAPTSALANDTDEHCRVTRE
jgi:hypothetical protein